MVGMYNAKALSITNNIFAKGSDENASSVILKSKSYIYRNLNVSVITNYTENMIP